MGTQRNANNTMDIIKPMDDFEKYGLLDNDADDQPDGALTTQCCNAVRHYSTFSARDGGRDVVSFSFCRCMRPAVTSKG